ncbi:MAG: EamA family transporter [Acidimicrobiia bacterium]|nr:EamA family transporter [Acidimicrobiia bacterium]NNL97237.1 EamA family transporter [Acidimicrobiia bacterium]
MSHAFRPATAGVLFALTAAALYGVSGAIAADVFDEVSPARVSQIRAFIAAGVLVPYAWSRGVLNPHGQLRLLALLGLNLALVGLTFYWALDRLGVGPGATMQFLGPFMVLAYMALVQRRPVGRFTWGAAALALLGVGLITEAWAFDDLDALGLASGITTAALFAGYFLLGEHLGKTLPALTMIAWGFLFASVFWVIVLPVWSFPGGLSGSVWAKLVWVGIGGTALPFLAQFAALRRVASGIVGVVATAEPVIAAAAAWVILDQSLSALQILGGLIVVLAVAAVHRWTVVDVEQPLDGVF